MKIGELARETGLTIRTIRYYEELGLLEPLQRSKGGFRLFSEDDIDRIKLIHLLKGMNLPLEKIKELLSSRKQGATMGAVVNTILTHLNSYAEEAQQQIERYQKLKTDLEKSSSILQKCIDCNRFPADASCADCEVISKTDYPILVRLIF